LGVPIPFSVDKPFTIVKKNGIIKPFDEVVKVEDIKVENVEVVEVEKVDDFDYIREKDSFICWS
jgi:hypothetical protein